MGRLFLGIGLLLGLLGLGLYSAWAINDTHKPMAASLEQAAQQQEQSAAKALLQQAQQDWARHLHATATLSEHDPLEEIESLFSQAQAYVNAGQMGDFSATCLRLSQLIRATAESHNPTWWNFL